MILAVYAPPEFGDIAALLDELAERRPTVVHTNSAMVREAADVLGVECVLHRPNFKFLSATLPILAVGLAMSANTEAALAFTPTRPDDCFDEFVRTARGLCHLEIL